MNPAMRKTYIGIGILSIIIGLMMLIVPHQCIKAIVIILGIFSIGNGIFNLFSIRKLIADSNFVKTITIRGTISIIVGLLAIFLPLVFAGILCLTWGGYAPGFGMLGTLIGLIQMLQNLSDASTIASGMGTALITTFYGSLLGNLFCNPIGANLAKKSEAEVVLKQMALEGILAIQSGVNPRIVEEKLITYLEPAERLEYLQNNSENNEGVA